jgi:membrane associated rhomboid family serine protease
MNDTAATDVFKFKFKLFAQSRWRWTGTGTLRFEAGQCVLTGLRYRPLFFAAKQEIRFSPEAVRDVVQNGSTVACQVLVANQKPEPMLITLDDEAAAAALVSRWPKDRTEASLEVQSFRETLEKLGTKVWVTPALIALCVGIFVWMAITGVSVMAPQGPELIPWGSNFAPMTVHGQGWRLLTSMFLHFGLIHLAFNMWALASMGPLAERYFGNGRYLLIYVFAGLTGSIASVLWNPLVNIAGLAKGAAAAMAIVIAVSWPLFHPSASAQSRRDFRDQYVEFGRKEELALKAEQDLQAMRETQKLTVGRWATLLRHDVLPLWQQVADYERDTPIPVDSKSAAARCGRKLKIIASIEEPEVIARILAHLEKAASDDSRPELVPRAAWAPPAQWPLL